ncbi:MAG: SdiA-regulated domain-containing protein [Proteobacteria bacterium]|nr:SdiA-regulated domain-containing protein [Pseudomonadota bacterium]
MATWTRWCVVVATIATGCAQDRIDPIAPFVDDNKADGRGKKLQQLDDFKVDMDEPSDLTMANGQLYGISDAHSRIYKIDVTGSHTGGVDKVLDIVGSDLEALSYEESTNRFLIGDESNGKVWFIGADGERHDPIEIKDAIDGNSGIEGLCYDDQGHLLVGKEKDPARIFEMNDAGEQLHQTKVDFASDLSALAWNPKDDHLYALSDEEHALYRLNKNYEATQAWRLPIEHPEGLAFDGDTIYVVSDSEARLYLFELD